MLSIVFFYLSQIGAYILSLSYSPALAFVGYQLVYFFYHPTRWYYWQLPQLPYSFGMSVLVLGVAFFDRRRTSPSPMLGSAIMRWMWVVVALHGLAYFGASLPDYHWETFVNFFKLALIVTCAYKLCADKKSLDWFMYAYVFGSGYLGYYLFDIGRNSGNRVTGFGLVDAPDVNAVAAMLGPASIFALHFFWKNEGWRRWLMVIGGGFIVNALVLMNSRGAFLGVFVGAAYYVGRMYLLGDVIKVSRARIVGIVLIGLLALFRLFDQSAIERFLSIGEATELSEESETGSTRVYFWMAAFEMSKDYPFGLGSGGFVVNSPRYIPEYVNTGRSRNRAVHSTWFETLTEIGYPGLLAFCMMLFSAAVLTQRTLNRSIAIGDPNAALTALVVQAALLAYLASATFLDRMRAEALYWLVLFAACLYNVYVVQAEVAIAKVVTRKRMS